MGACRTIASDPRFGGLEIEGLPPGAPRPRGPRVLVECRKAGEKLLGMFVMAEETKKTKEYLNPVCKLVAISRDAFADESRFPSGATAEIGDWVITNPYSGERHEIKHVVDQQETTTTYRLLYCDEIKGVVADPDALVVVTD